MYISFLILAQGVQPLILYNYLLSHEQQYSMEVMQLQPEPHDQTAADQLENEYVLVQTSSHKVPYRDHQVKAFFFTPVPRVKIIVIDRNRIRSFKENKNLKFYPDATYKKKHLDFLQYVFKVIIFSICFRCSQYVNNKKDLQQNNFDIRTPNA